jgi:hypothetical protein
MGDDRAGGAAAPEGESREHRAVPVEAMRRFAQDQAELTSIRQVAAEIGLGRTTLHKFVAGETMPHPRVRRLLALWYLRRQGHAAGDDVAVRPYASALQILLGGVPEDVRERTTAEVLDVLERGYATAGEPPAWLDALRATSNEDEDGGTPGAQAPSVA